MAAASGSATADEPPSQLGVGALVNLWRMIVEDRRTEAESRRQETWFVLMSNDLQKLNDLVDLFRDLLESVEPGAVRDAYNLFRRERAKLQDYKGQGSVPPEAHRMFLEKIGDLLQERVESLMGNDPRPAAAESVAECQRRQDAFNTICSEYTAFIERRKSQAKMNEVDDLEKQVEASLKPSQDQLNKCKEDLAVARGTDMTEMFERLGKSHFVKIQGSANLQMLLGALEDAGPANELRLRERLKLPSQEPVPQGAILVTHVLELKLKEFGRRQRLNLVTNRAPVLPPAFDECWAVFREQVDEGSTAAEKYSVVRAVRAAVAFRRESVRNFLAERAEGPSAEILQRLSQRVLDQKGPANVDPEVDGEDYFRALRSGQWATVFSILQQHPGLIRQRKFRFAAIHQAAILPDATNLKTLVEEFNADLLQLTSDGKTAEELEEASDACKQYLRQRLQERPNIDSLVRSISDMSVRFQQDATVPLDVVTHTVQKLCEEEALHEQKLERMREIQASGRRALTDSDTDCLNKEMEVFNAYEVLLKKKDEYIVQRSRCESLRVLVNQQDKQVTTQEERTSGVREAKVSAEQVQAAMARKLEQLKPAGGLASEQLKDFRFKKALRLLKDQKVAKSLMEKASTSCQDETHVLLERAGLLESKQKEYSDHQTVCSFARAINKVGAHQKFVSEQQASVDGFIDQLTKEYDSFGDDLELENYIAEQDIQEEVQELWGDAYVDSRLMDILKEDSDGSFMLPSFGGPSLGGGYPPSASSHGDMQIATIQPNLVEALAEAIFKRMEWSQVAAHSAAGIHQARRGGAPYAPSQVSAEDTYPPILGMSLDRSQSQGSQASARGQPQGSQGSSGGQNPRPSDGAQAQGSGASASGQSQGSQASPSDQKR